jgi:hypothetical protein
MDELVSADGHADMRGTWRRCREKDQVTSLKIAEGHIGAGLVKVAHGPRYGYAVLREYILDETAAIESARVRAAVPIRCPAEGERRPGD